MQKREAKDAKELEKLAKLATKVCCLTSALPLLRVLWCLCPRCWPVWTCRKVRVAPRWMRAARSWRRSVQRRGRAARSSSTGSPCGCTDWLHPLAEAAGSRIGKHEHPACVPLAGHYLSFTLTAMSGLQTVQRLSLLTPAADWLHTAT